jgi:phytol kinase
MTDVWPSIPHVALAGGAFVALLAACATLQRSARLPAESARKLFHAGVGLIALSLPLLFESPAPVLMLCAGSAAVLALVRWHRTARARFGCVLHGVARRSYGEFAFAAGVAIAFALFHERPLLYAVPLATLTFADAAAALVGSRFGRHRYRAADGRKSVEGSLAFCAVAFACAYVALAVTHATSPLAAPLVALLFALTTTWVEAACWYGSDNLGIPLAGGTALAIFVSWSPEELVSRSVVLAATAATAVAVASLRARLERSAAARFTRAALPVVRG